MTRLVVVLLAAGVAAAAAACRKDVSVESKTQPLAPAGDPVAQRDEPATADDYDVSDELPPSLYDGADQKRPPMTKPAVAVATPRIVPVTSALCVTTGAAAIGAKIEQAAMRAVAKQTAGDAAEMSFVFHGETATTKRLASGSLRRQLGLKLRAENGCNLLYVMWRLDPKPMVYVSMKRNPGAKDHKGCGANGYMKIKPTESKDPPELRFGEKHTLRAVIDANEELSVFIDDDLHWRGPLPASAKELRGPAGIRSDNLAFDLLGFGAPTTTTTHGNAKCVAEDDG